MRQNMSAVEKEKSRGEGACQLDQGEAAAGCKMAALGMEMLCLANLRKKSKDVQGKQAYISNNKVESTLG